MFWLWLVSLQIYVRANTKLPIRREEHFSRQFYASYSGVNRNEKTDKNLRFLYRSMLCFRVCRRYVDMICFENPKLKTAKHTIHTVLYRNRSNAEQKNLMRSHLETFHIPIVLKNSCIVQQNFVLTLTNMTFLWD
jgi:hypothetical protein